MNIEEAESLVTLIEEALMIMNSKRIRVKICKGHAVAEEVSRQFPTIGAPVRVRGKSCWLYGGQSDTEAGFSVCFLFSPPIAPQSSSSNI
jgi:hypothetical protein